MCDPKEGAITLYYIFSLYETVKLHTFFYSFSLIVLKDDVCSEVFWVYMNKQYISELDSTY